MKIVTTSKQFSLANTLRNNERRKVLKGVAAATAAAVGSVLLPSMASACAAHAKSHLSETVDDDTIYVEFSDPEANFVDGVLARVSIHNNGEHEIRLSHLSTSNVTTKHGVYDINSRLYRSPVAVAPGGVYHFWLSPSNARELPAGTFPSPALSKSVSTTTLQLRVVRGENQWVSAHDTRLLDAPIEYSTA